MSNTTDNDDIAAKLLRVVTHKKFVSLEYSFAGKIWWIARREKRIVTTINGATLPEVLDAFLEAVSDED